MGEWVLRISCDSGFWLVGYLVLGLHRFTRLRD